MFILYNRTNRARTIAQELKVCRYYPYEGRFLRPDNPRSMTHIVNWGCVQISFDVGQQVLNPDLRIAASKRATYTALEQAGIETIHWYEDGRHARISGHPFLGRRDGLSGGKGIVIYEAGQRPAVHDFYVRTIACRREYRIHVFDSRVIAIQKKLLRNATSIIHNHDNGVTFQWIAPEDFDIGERHTHAIKQLAIDAVAVVGLDFGAVDIIQERETNNLYVLEVNSAPGIRTDQIYTAYLEAFRSYRVGG